MILRNEECQHRFVRKNSKEICEECGLVVFDARSIALDEMMNSDLNLKEEILLALYLLPQNMSMGITKFMKEIFLMDREGPEISIKLPRAGFKAWRYGPYSIDIIEEIEGLEQEDLAKVIEDKDRKAEEIHLTKKGIEEAEAILKNQTKEDIEEIKRFLTRLETMSQHQLIRYVYANYPSYTSKSEIKDKVLKT